MRMSWIWEVAHLSQLSPIHNSDSTQHNHNFVSLLALRAKMAMSWVGCLHSFTAHRISTVKALTNSDNFYNFHDNRSGKTFGCELFTERIFFLLIYTAMWIKTMLSVTCQTDYACSLWAFQELPLFIPDSSTQHLELICSMWRVPFIQQQWVKLSYWSVPQHRWWLDILIILLWSEKAPQHSCLSLSKASVKKR